MIPRAFVCFLLALTTSALTAQYFSSVASEPRRTARATWLGMSGEQSVTLEYGQPKWRADHERVLQQLSAGPLILGKGALTTLRTDVDLAFGEQKLARGRWYVGARHTEQRGGSLALFAADRIDASGRGTTAILATEPDLLVPMLMAREEEPVELFEITLSESKATPHNLALAIAWGPYRMGTAIAAAFDTRKPEGTPEFALTEPGKGIKTASGLIYEPLHAGAGAPPGPNDTVRAHYAGWLTDGTMFYSTHLRGEPETLKSEWVEKGFAEGLQLMQPGATFRLTIPPELARGAAGSGDRIPPNATLVFTVTLLSIDRR